MNEFRHVDHQFFQALSRATAPNTAFAQTLGLGLPGFLDKLRLAKYNNVNGQDGQYNSIRCRRRRWPYPDPPSTIEPSYPFKILEWRTLNDFWRTYEGGHRRAGRLTLAQHILQLRAEADMNGERAAGRPSRRSRCTYGTHVQLDQADDDLQVQLCWSHKEVVDEALKQKACRTFRYANV